MRRHLVAVWATLLLAACGTDGGTSEDRGGAGMRPSGPSSASASAPTPLAQQAVADLAERLGLPQDDIVVERVEEVTWRDGSLGCAEKGMSYTQALVDGSRIVLQAGGKTYEYHAGGNRAPFLCENPTQ